MSTEPQSSAITQRQSLRPCGQETRVDEALIVEYLSSWVASNHTVDSEKSLDTIWVFRHALADVAANEYTPTSVGE